MGWDGNGTPKVLSSAFLFVFSAGGWMMIERSNQTRQMQYDVMQCDAI
jgi:hypothetical protein